MLTSDTRSLKDHQSMPRTENTGTIKLRIRFLLLRLLQQSSRNENGSYTIYPLMTNLCYQNETLELRMT